MCAAFSGCEVAVQREDAEKLIPEDASGVYNITSSEELDAFLKLFPEKVVCSFLWAQRAYPVRLA
jgi:hypothetical protein